MWLISCKACTTCEKHGLCTGPKSTRYKAAMHAPPCGYTITHWPHCTQYKYIQNIFKRTESLPHWSHLQELQDRAHHPGHQQGVNQSLLNLNHGIRDELHSDKAVEQSAGCTMIWCPMCEERLHRVCRDFVLTLRLPGDVRTRRMLAWPRHCNSCAEWVALTTAFHAVVQQYAAPHCSLPHTPCGGASWNVLQHSTAQRSTHADRQWAR